MRDLRHLALVLTVVCFCQLAPRTQAQCAAQCFSGLGEWVGGSTSIDISWNPSELSVTGMYACSLAEASSVNYASQDCEGHAGSAVHQRAAEFECSNYMGTSARAQVDPHDIVGWGACSYAHTTEPAPFTGPEMCLESSVSYGCIHCWDHNGNPYCGIPAGIAGSRSTVWYIIEASVNGEQAASSRTTAWTADVIRYMLLSPDAGPPKLHRVAWILDPSPQEAAWVVRAGDRLAHSDNMVIVPGFEHLYSSNTSVTGTAGLSVVGSRTVAFDDGRMDVSGALGLDAIGRFDEGDVVPLQSLIGSTEPNYVSRWDFNGNGVIDDQVGWLGSNTVPGDVATMQAMLQLGLGSGVLGDSNGDGAFTCSDWASIVPFPQKVLGESGYKSALDADLDGDNDPADQAAILAAWGGGGDCDSDGVPDACQPCAGDMNCDGVVSFGDIDLLIASFAYPGCIGWPECCPCSRGDLNSDGVNNFFDIDPFVARIGTTCP